MDRTQLTKIHNFDNDRGCFACGTDNPVGLHMEFYSDGESERFMNPTER